MTVCRIHTSFTSGFVDCERFEFSFHPSLIENGNIIREQINFEKMKDQQDSQITKDFHTTLRHKGGLSPTVMSRRRHLRSSSAPESDEMRSHNVPEGYGPAASIPSEGFMFNPECILRRSRSTALTRHEQRHRQHISEICTSVAIMLMG